METEDGICELVRWSGPPPEGGRLVDFRCDTCGELMFHQCQASNGTMCGLCEDAPDEPERDGQGYYFRCPKCGAKNRVGVEGSQVVRTVP